MALDLVASDRVGRVAFLALIAGALAIAFSPIFVRISELPPTATAFWRVALALPLCLIWLGLDRKRRPPRAQALTSREIGWLIMPGLFFAGDLFFWHWAIQFTSVANSTLMANFAPVFVVLGGFLLFGERVSRRFLTALALSLAGAAILMGDSFAIGLETLFGDALGLITAMFYAGYLMVVARLRTRFSTAEIMSWSTGATALALLVVTLAIGDPLLPESASGWAILIGLAWIGQFAGQGLIAYALAHLPASFSSLSLLIQPVAAAFLAWGLLAEPLGGWQVVGGLIVLAGIFLARRAMRRVAPKAA